MTNAFAILSYNVASSNSLSRLSQLLDQFKPSLVLLQEVTINTSQLNFLLGSCYWGQCNTDPNDNKPGTALAWKCNMDVEVYNIVPRRMQYFKYNHIDLSIFMPPLGPKDSMEEDNFSRLTFLTFYLESVAQISLCWVEIGTVLSAHKMLQNHDD